MKEIIEQRFTDLIEEGKNLVSKIDTKGNYIPRGEIHAAQSLAGFLL